MSEKANRREDADSGKSNSRLAIAGTAIGSTLGIIGAFIGAFELSSIWGSGTFFPFLYEEHPNLEVFGFLAIFILGVTFIFLPKFKSRKLFSTKLAWESIALIALGNILVLFTVDKFLELDDVLIVGGVLLAMLLVFDVLGKPSGPLAVSEPFVWLSIVSLLIASLLKSYFDSNLVNSSWDSFPFLEIALISFPAAMIFGIEARTMLFRFAKIKKRTVLLSFCLLLPATLAAVLSSIPLKVSFVSFLDLGATVLYLASGITFLLGVSAFRESAPHETFQKISEGNLVRYRYFARAFRISAYWLVFSLVLAFAYSALEFGSSSSALFWIKDAFIHSMAIGFIASAIAAYSPILLPSVISGRVPYRGLTNIPLFLVTAGTVWRVAADIIAFLKLPTSQLFAGYSGALVIIGMLWFVLMNHRLR